MLKLGENLKKFRLKRELTQEQLADVIGVSAQAVSRWENGTTYPDITLLPTIASYFDVSIDEIMGFDCARKEEKIKSILKQNRIFHNNGETKKSIELLRQGIVDFPNESRLLYCLAQSIYSLHFQSGEMFTDEERKNAAEEAVELLNKALRYVDENFDEGGACRQLLVYNYLKLGEREKAREAALKAPFLPCCREILLPETLQGNEAVEEYQKNILHFSIGLYHMISNLRNCGDYTNEQRIEISLMAEKFLQLIGGENSGFDKLFYNSIVLLGIYTEIKDKEKTLEYLEKALKYADDCEKRPDRTNYSVPWLYLCENNSENRMKHSKKTLYDSLFEFVSQHALSGWLEDNSRFIAVLEKIKTYC